MKFSITHIVKELFSEFFLTEQQKRDRYYAQANDLADLERRMKKYDSKGRI